MLVHKHMIVRAEVKKPLTCVKKAEEWMKSLVEKINMKIVSGPHIAYVDKPGNRGLTGIVIIETSHCAIHVWDEANPSLVQLDVYTCSHLEIDTVLNHFAEFEPVNLEYKFLDRENGLVVIK